MTKGTTPTLKFKLDRTKFNLSNITLDAIWVTIQSKYKEYNQNFTKDDVTIDTTNNSINLALTQEQTLAMPNALLNVQLRLLDSDNKAYATKIKQINVARVLKEGVIADV